MLRQKAGAKSIFHGLSRRMEEESNIEWARTLEDAGVHVVYGIVGMKVHSKIALVVRREGDAIRRYLRVISIVGRFLEHSRIYYFRNGGAEEVYLGSADLMRRNLSHRVEIIFPVENAGLVRNGGASPRPSKSLPEIRAGAWGPRAARRPNAQDLCLHPLV
jgi:polyphosphate kinase